ncbi:MAG: histidine kinase [Flaviaesturariibacter sp.]|nr:histidine kinase [Flaviaesturariibacter sp.]
MLLNPSYLFHSTYTGYDLCLYRYHTMNTNGPVIVIEDDADDQDLMTLVFKELGYKNKIWFFRDGQTALDHLNRTDVIPFLILSDINMPIIDGFALRSKIKMDAKLQIKCIPYLFFTTSASQQAVIDAYSMSVQGFFVKDNTMEGLRDTMKVIIEYWKKCSSPNNFR